MGIQIIEGGQVVMVLAYYVSMCALSLVCCTIYYFIKRSYFPFRYSTVFILAFLSQFCYVLLALSKDVREALIIYKFLYIGGCFLPLAGLFMILSVCKIELPKWVKFFLILISAGTYCLVLSAGYSPLFYKSVDLEFKNGVAVLVKDYGPLHILFYIEIGIFLVLTVFAVVYGWMEKPNASRKNLVLGSFLEIVAIIAFFVGRIFTKDIEWIALADLIIEIGFLFIMNNIGLYTVDNMVSSSILADGGFGYISLDFKKRYLSSTDVAKKFIPEIADNHADHYIEDEELRRLFESWVDEFKTKKTSQNHTYKKGDTEYVVRVSFLYDGKKKRGYLLEISDDTVNQPVIKPVED